MTCRETAGNMPLNLHDMRETLPCHSPATALKKKDRDTCRDRTHTTKGHYSCLCDFSPVAHFLLLPTLGKELLSVSVSGNKKKKRPAFSHVEETAALGNLRDFCTHTASQPIGVTGLSLFALSPEQTADLPDRPGLP